MKQRVFSEKVFITAGGLLLIVIVIGLGIIVWNLLSTQEVLTKENALLGARVDELAAEVQRARGMSRIQPSSLPAPAPAQGVRFAVRTMPTLTLGMPHVVYWVASSSVREVFISVEREGMLYRLARVASGTADFLEMTTELEPLPAGEYYGVYEWDAGATQDGTALGEGEGYRIVISHQGFEKENAEDITDVFSLVE